MEVQDDALGRSVVGCNMDPSGTKGVEFSPVLRRCFGRHAQDYALPVAQAK